MRRSIGPVLAGLLLGSVALVAGEPKPPGLTPEEQQLAAQARQLNQDGVQLLRQGKPAEAVAKLRQALELHQRLYPASRYPAGHPNLAASLNNMGFVLRAAGAAEKALPFYEQALAMRRKLYPESQYPAGHPELAGSLNNVGFILQAIGSPHRALPYFDQALAMNRKLYPKESYPHGHADLARSLNNLGLVLQAAGSAEKALPFYEQALAMNRTLYPREKYPDGHLDLALSLNNVGFGLQAAGSVEQALPYFEQALAMRRALYPEARFPGGHPELAASLNNVAAALQLVGSVEKALPFFEQALAMRRTLYPESRYPRGHPDLADSLNNLGSAWDAAGSVEKALLFFEQALAMRRKLYPASHYPDGHPVLAISLNNMGFALQAVGLLEEAGPFYEQALAMFQKLYPRSRYPAGHPDLANVLNNLGLLRTASGATAQALPYFEQALAMRRSLHPVKQNPTGHPGLARSLNNIGFALQEARSAEKALPFFEQALAMRRTLYPEARFPGGHPDLAESLGNMGAALWVAGSVEKSLSFYEQSLAMHRRLGQGLVLASSEAGALAYLQRQPWMREIYLGIAMAQGHTGAAIYRTVWDSKAAVTRLLELRQAAARAAGPVTDHLNRLKALRCRTDQLLHDSNLALDQRDQELVRLAEERDALERRLARDLPIVTRWTERDGWTPEDLARALPAGVAFIDLLAWNRFQKDPQVKAIPSYLAFVVTPGRPVRRIDLGPAEPINAAVRSWRQAIERQQGDDAAEPLRTLLWDKISPHLPPGTTTLYLAPDGDLARLPWAALPLGNDRILLERLAVATVPHGPFLLEQLHQPHRSTAPEPLLLGDVTYHSTAWPALPGTRTELASLLALAPATARVLRQDEATAAKLIQALPQARYAHLATHGEFQTASFAAERKRAEEARKSWREGMSQDGRRVAAKNPLGYVGLVLAHGEVLSGLSILDLNLEQLRLVTLSACETGLGEYTGGKGVENLQQAFHLAGCPNVVASLWKVDDAATAALMTQFYHELWINKKPPLEALHQAQLTLYRHPERIAALAGERGRPALELAAKLGSAAPVPSDARGKRTPTKLWAAFVLSGVGK